MGVGVRTWGASRGASGGAGAEGSRGEASAGAAVLLLGSWELQGAVQPPEEEWRYGDAGGANEAVKVGIETWDSLKEVELWWEGEGCADAGALG